MTSGLAQPELPSRKRHWTWDIAGFVGVLSLAMAWIAIEPYQINVVRYELQKLESPRALSVQVFLCLLVFTLILPAVFASGQLAQSRSRVGFFLAPLLATLPLAACGILRVVAPASFVLLAILGAGASAYLSGAHIRITGTPKRALAIAALIFAIALLTLVHIRIQLNYYNHFMFGHADIGHFTEELKNALARRGLRSDSFENTRLGWHFVPLMYILVPGYALWPSITYLMTLGPLVLHAAALPVYWFAQRQSRSVLVAFLCALAWLLLPSLSRLVYSNTYGFAWLYTSVPVLGFLLGAALLQRWKLCWVLVAVLLLSRETHTAITFGFGLYLGLFSLRRRAGLAVMAISVAYAVLCAAVIIPFFAKTGRYERLDIFGELGDSLGQLALSTFTRPDVFFGRLARAQSVNFVLLLLTTMCFLPVGGWRLAIAALPALLVHLLMENTDWISIKFWHHAMVLPILFFAALSSLSAVTQPLSLSGRVQQGEGGDLRHHLARERNLGIALALLMCAGWSHYFFGFSPLSKAYEPYSADEFLQNPDPRLAFVEHLRREIPRDRTILATERLAAHFTDYRRIYTGRRPLPSDFVILDLSDAWDTSGLPQRAAEFAASPDYTVYAESGPIIVFARRPDAPPIPLDP